MIQKLIWAGIMGSEKWSICFQRVLLMPFSSMKVPEPAGEHQEQHTHEVAADDGQQIAVRPPAETHQIEHIKRHGGYGAQHTVHGHQLVPLAAAHELGAEGAQAAHQDVNINEQAVLGHIGQKLRHRPAEHEDAEAAEDGEQAVGEHLLFAVALVQTKADDGVGHSHRHKGDEQVCVLAQNLDRPRSEISAMA